MNVVDKEVELARRIDRDLLPRMRRVTRRICPHEAPLSLSVRGWVPLSVPLRVDELDKLPGACGARLQQLARGHEVVVGRRWLLREVDHLHVLNAKGQALLVATLHKGHPDAGHNRVCQRLVRLEQNAQVIQLKVKLQQAQDGVFLVRRCVALVARGELRTRPAADAIVPEVVKL